MSQYQPTCAQTALYARAKLYQQIRAFFAQRGVLEVETPILASSATTDVYLSSVKATRTIAGQAQTHYLQTSPEFAMKRLLASGSGAIYQICKVFRDDEHGRKHNSEFTMLEWYRPDFDLADLMQEVQDLLQCCFEKPLHIQQLSYKNAFKAYLNLNPLQADWQTLKHIATQHGLDVDLGEQRLAYMDLLFSHLVEPHLGKEQPLFLTDFPPELASLAKTKIDAEGERVAARFELYIDGLELANAYDELRDTEILRQRFQQDNAERQQQGLAVMPIDEYLLDAIPHMPECAGIALGLDRLLMVILQKSSLADVVSFPADRI